MFVENDSFTIDYLEHHGGLSLTPVPQWTHLCDYEHITTVGLTAIGSPLRGYKLPLYAFSEFLDSMQTITETPISPALAPWEDDPRFVDSIKESWREMRDAAEFALQLAGVAYAKQV